MSKKVKKDGRRKGIQRYRCLACGSYFSSKRRANLTWVAQAYNDYSVHKQTYAELSQKYGRSCRTLRKYFDEHTAVTGEVKARNEAFVLILDATFFGRGYGILLARCPKKVVYRSAYRSLRTNLPYLFTFQHQPNLKVPNTTNHCDRLFAHIKQKVLIHRGIAKRRRKKMIDYLLENF